MTVKQLTKEQAVIISGYTGVLMCNFGLLHEDVERRLGRPVFTHEFASPHFKEVLERAYKDDLIAICHKEGQDES